MSKGFYQMPYPVNEEVKNYEPNSKELESLLNKYEELYHQNPIHIPLYVGNEEITTKKNYQSILHMIINTNSVNLVWEMHHMLKRQLIMR